jgi:hypothetical protein
MISDVHIVRTKDIDVDIDSLWSICHRTQGLGTIHIDRDSIGRADTVPHRRPYDVARAKKEEEEVRVLLFSNTAVTLLTITLVFDLSPTTDPMTLLREEEEEEEEEE